MKFSDVWGHAEAANDALVDCLDALIRAAKAPREIAGEPRHWKVQAARRHFTVARQHLDILRREPTGPELLSGLFEPIDVVLENEVDVAMRAVVSMLENIGELLRRLERAGRALAT